MLTSLNLRADADCEDPSQQFVSLDTSWQTTDDLYQVWISQRQSDERGANIARDSWAEFWHDGYHYSVSVSQAYPIKTIAYPEDDGDRSDEPVIEPAFAPNTAELQALLEDVRRRADW